VRPFGTHTGYGTIDQPRIQTMQMFVTDAEPFRDAGPEVLNEYVRFADE
jgi:hypothetical protein